MVFPPFKISFVFLKWDFFRNGVSLEIHTDQGHNFDSKFVKSLTQVLCIRKTKTNSTQHLMDKYKNNTKPF